MSIKYPIEVHNIKAINTSYVEKGPFCSAKCGDLVKVRPCAQIYEGKTFLGFYIGDIALGHHVFFNEKDEDPGTLEIMFHQNPAIFVPELKKIIFGVESWWGPIKDESELKEITDDDIQNVWYVKLLKAMEAEKKEADGDG